jgi:hypothetical protein
VLLGAGWGRLRGKQCAHVHRGRKCCALRDFLAPWRNRPGISAPACIGTYMLCAQDWLAITFSNSTAAPASMRPHASGRICSALRETTVHGSEYPPSGTAGPRIELSPGIGGRHSHQSPPRGALPRESPNTLYRSFPKRTAPDRDLESRHEKSRTPLLQFCGAAPRSVAPRCPPPLHPLLTRTQRRRHRLCHVSVRFAVRPR